MKRVFMCVILCVSTLAGGPLVTADWPLGSAASARPGPGGDQPWDPCYLAGYHPIFWDLCLLELWWDYGECFPGHPDCY